MDIQQKSETIIHPIWFSYALECKKDLEHKFKLINFIKNNLDNAYSKSLFTGKTYTNEHSDIDDFLSHLKRQKNTNHIIIFEQCITLIQIITLGKKRGLWNNLCFPPIPFSYKRPKSVLNKNSLPKLKFYKIWLNHIYQSIDKKTELSNEAKLGRILLSSILRGGLLSTNSLSSLLLNLKKYQVIDNQLFVDLSLSYQGHEFIETRRWRPDILSEILLIKLNNNLIDDFPEDKKHQTKFIFKCIKVFLSETQIEKSDMPSNITEVLESVKINYDLNIPFIITNWANQKHISHSCEIDAYSRVFYSLTSNKPLTSYIEHPEDGALSVSSLSQKEETSTLITNNILLYEKIEHLNKNQAISYLYKNIQSNKFTPRNISNLIESWIHHLLTKKRNIEFSSALSYLRTIGKVLTMILYNVDMLSLKSEDFEEIYALILDEHYGQQQSKIARLLRNFHKYIVKKHNIVKIDLHEIIGIFCKPSSVDANFVNFDEYYRIKSSLHKSDLVLKSPDAVTIAKLLLALGFKCGLRQSEAHKILLSDIYHLDNNSTILLIRPHLSHKLKTKSSTRKIPLHLLLDHRELDLFLSFFKTRIDSESKEAFSPYLFSIPNKNYFIIDKKNIFKEINRIIKEVTNDSSLRFHHLRHSFASWLFFRFFITDYNLTYDELKALPYTYNWLNEGTVFYKNFYTFHPKKCNQKHAFSVCVLLGHSSPKVTLHHYIHVMDILIYKFLDLDSRFQKPSIKTLSIASDIPLSTAHRIFNSQGHKGLKKKIYTSNNIVDIATIKNKKSFETQHNNDLSINNDDFLVYLEDTWKILFLYSEHRMDSEYISKRFAISENKVVQYIERAQSIFQLKQNNREKTYRFSRKTSKLKKNKHRLILSPTNITRRVDKEFIYEFNNSYDDSNYLDLSKSVISFLNNAWRTRHLCVFDNNESLTFFITALEKIFHKNIAFKFSKIQNNTSQTISKNKAINSLKKKVKNKINIGVDVFFDETNVNLAVRYLYFLLAIIDNNINIHSDDNIVSIVDTSYSHIYCPNTL